jgi:imidazolonepropionase-like amidohydrolase
MTPMQAIVSTTRTAAECCRVDHLTGTLEVGKRADIIGVDGNPLDDIRLLQDKARLPLIVADGRTFKSSVSSPAPV